MDHSSLNGVFANTEYAFKEYTDRQLNKRYRWFKLIGNPVVYKILNATAPIIRILPNTILRAMKKVGLYYYFFTGETLFECQNYVAKLFEKDISSIPDFCVESIKNQKEADFVLRELDKLFEFAKSQNKKIPTIVFKVTGVIRREILEHINNQLSSSYPLSSLDKRHLEEILSVIDKICYKAYLASVKIMADAEESWIQGTIDYILLEMQRRYNKDKVIVINTYQMYKVNGLDILNNHISKANQEGFMLGCKLVRGAYIEKEKKRAIAKKYNNPIFESKEQTDKAYNSAIELCIESLENIFLVAATHNEQSLKKLINLMTIKKIPKSTSHIFISQLYGMGDIMSYNLSALGYNVSKYLPYGPIKESIPYLIRRAKENSSIKTMTNTEVMILKQEIDRRQNNN